MLLINFLNKLLNLKIAHHPTKKKLSDLRIMVDIALTKIVLKQGMDDEDESRSRVVIGDVCQVSIKLLFDKHLLRTDIHDSDSLLGVAQLRSDSATECFIKLGYFNTRIMQIIHGAVQTMRMGELCQVSFELDPEELDDPLERGGRADRVFLDLKFELGLIGKGKSEKGHVFLWNF